jgi:GGDEF domain-containing protein
MSTPPGFVREGLGRLLDQLSRDGSLVGLNTDADPALARMDPKTGVYNRAYLEELIREAVFDARAHRSPRLLDGPEPGSIALISIRISDWDTYVESGEQTRTRLEIEVARRLASCLRAEDALGRASADTFVLLLRGCPSEQLKAIAERCAAVIRHPPIVTDCGPLRLGADAATTHWRDEDPSDFIQRALDDIGGAASSEV